MATLQRGFDWAVAVAAAAWLEGGATALSDPPPHDASARQASSGDKKSSLRSLESWFIAARSPGREMTGMPVREYRRAQRGEHSVRWQASTADRELASEVEPCRWFHSFPIPARRRSASDGQAGGCKHVRTVIAPPTNEGGSRIAVRRLEEQN